MRPSTRGEAVSVVSPQGHENRNHCTAAHAARTKNTAEAALARTRVTCALIYCCWERGMAESLWGTGRQGIFYKVKHALTIRLSNPNPRFLPKKMCAPAKHLYLNAYHNLVYNGPKRATTQLKSKLIHP